MSYAIFKSGGKQYRVQEGDKIDVDRLDAEVGSITSFGEVLMIGDGDSLKIGDPLVEGARVTAEILDQHRAKKVTAFKFRRRKGFSKTKGHRQPLTRVAIKSIKS